MLVATGTARARHLAGDDYFWLRNGQRVFRSHALEALHRSLLAAVSCGGIRKGAGSRGFVASTTCQGHERCPQGIGAAIQRHDVRVSPPRRIIAAAPYHPIIMKTQYYTAASLDGFIADPQNGLEWLLQFGLTDDYPDFIRDVGALAMGSTTYEWILADLHRAEDATPPAWPYEQPTWVFTSRSLPQVAGADVRFVSGDVRPVHEQMTEAAGGKNIWLVGGGELVGQFYDHGLVDDLIVTVAPVTLAGGAPLLPRVITTPPLRLVSARTCGADFVQLRYAFSHTERGRTAPDR